MTHKKTEPEVKFIKQLPAWFPTAKSGVKNITDQCLILASRRLTSLGFS
jgi:hypothetical protein